MRRPVTIPVGALVAAGLVLFVLLLVALSGPAGPGEKPGGFDLRSPGGLVDRVLPGGAPLWDRGPQAR